MLRRKGLLLVLFVSAFGCGAARPSNPPPSVALTAANYRTEISDLDASQVALARGEPVQALRMAERAIRLAPDDPWARYDHAVALIELGRTDEAVAELERAEAIYGDSHPHGKALAVYGRARAFARAGRCVEAKRAYEDYAALTRTVDPPSADMAIAYEAHCRESAAAVPDLTDADAALMGADYARALALATQRETAISPGRDHAWVEEARARALLGMGRTSDAAAAFDIAAREYGDAADRAGRARALYGEALALRAAASCKEAAAAYERYAAFVRPFAPEDAQMAERYSRDCPGLAPPPKKPPAPRKK